jgi:hypothetical protein
VSRRAQHVPGLDELDLGTARLDEIRAADENEQALLAEVAKLVAEGVLAPNGQPVLYGVQEIAENPRVCRCSSPQVEVDPEGDRYCAKCGKPLDPPRTVAEVDAEDAARLERDRQLALEGDE